MIFAMRPDRALIARNLRSAMSSYARSTERGATVDLGCASAAASGIDYAVFNAVVLSEGVTSKQFAVTLDSAAAFYRAHGGVGWSCWLDEAMVTPDGGRDTARLLEHHGLRWIAEHDGMVADRIRPGRRELPPLETQPVTTLQAREDFIHVCAQVFLLPGATARAIYGSARFWDGMMQGWVGYDRGQPVCIAVADADCDSVGLYSVATMPSHRGRGFGESITRHAVGRAAETSGFDRSILQSTAAGLRMYRRIGYEARNRITVWATP